MKISKFIYDFSTVIDLEHVTDDNRHAIKSHTGRVVRKLDPPSEHACFWSRKFRVADKTGACLFVYKHKNMHEWLIIYRSLFLKPGELHDDMTYIEYSPQLSMQWIRKVVSLWFHPNPRNVYQQLFFAFEHLVAAWDSICRSLQSFDEMFAWLLCARICSLLKMFSISF